MDIIKNITWQLQKQNLSGAVFPDRKFRGLSGLFLQLATLMPFGGVFRNSKNCSYLGSILIKC